MIKQLKRFVIMFQFMTTLPVRIKLEATDEDYGKGLVFAPLIGAVIGLLMALVLYVFRVFLRFDSPPVLAVIAVITYVLLTGGLHLDGLGDTFDGVFSGRTKERMLEIMRDSRVGTNAVLVLITVTLLNYSLIFHAFAEFDSRRVLSLIILFPVAGRIGSLISSGCTTYARSGPGLGKSFIDHCTYREIFLGLIGYFICFYGTLGLYGLVISVPPICTAFIITLSFSKKLNGVTGDVLGAVCELNQTAFLLITIIIEKLTGGILWI